MDPREALKSAANPLTSSATVRRDFAWEHGVTSSSSRVSVPRMSGSHGGSHCFERFLDLEWDLKEWYYIWDIGRTGGLHADGL